MKKARFLAIVLVLAMLVQMMPIMTLGVSAATTDTIVLYPEYPEKIEKDYMYRVYVSQGGEKYEIPVYNSMRHANNFVGSSYGTDSENDRRFCQFSATPSASNPVTIEIVSNASFTKYSIIPSTKNIASTVSSNKITFNVTEAGQYMFRLNDNNLTNLAIFVDEVETDVPNKSASNVVVFDESNPAPNAIGSKGTVYSSDTIFYIEDWQDVELFELQSGQKLYIAPGAVLNTRVQIMNNQSNITISGRGMLRDFNDTRAYNASDELQEKRMYYYLLTVGSSWNSRDTASNVAKNVTIKDIVLFDSKGFNLVFLGARNCSADNIKVISNEISTDGISFWNCEDISITNSYLYVADNIFVIDNCENVTMDNLLVGSSIATFFPQSKLEGTHKYTNINVFRSATLFEPNGLKYADGATMTIENLSAVDCVAPVGSDLGTSKMGKLFATYTGASDSSTVKTITFKNVTLPETDNSYVVEIGKNKAAAGNYVVNLQNVYVGTTALTSSNVNFTDATTSGKPSTVNVTNDSTYTPVTRNTKSASFTAYTTQIRNLDADQQWASTVGVIYYSKTQPYVKNDVKYVSAVGTAKELGLETYFDADDNTLTIYDEHTLARVTIGSTTALVNDKTVTLSGAVELGDEVMVPTDFFTKAFGCAITVRNSRDIIIDNYDKGANLAENGDFSDKNALESWTTLNFARLLLENGALRMGNKDVFKASELESYQGFYQDIRKDILQQGYGTYRITFRAKCNETVSNLSDTSTYFIAGTVHSGQATPSKLSDATAKALTNEWKEYTQDITIGKDSGTISLYNTAMYLTILVKGAIDVSIDDITFTKISDASSTSYTISGPSNNSLNYGSSGSVTISARNSNIESLTFSTTSSFLTVGTTSYSSSGSWFKTYTATATVSVTSPSSYTRTARVVAKDSSGNIVASYQLTIPATAGAGHVVDFDATVGTNNRVEKGQSANDVSVKLTNVLYNDGAIKTTSSGYTITGADFSTLGEKTINITYDNKTITKKVTVVAAGTLPTEPQEDTIVLYPEYPEEIARDYMYRVYVSQGGQEYEIPVYNSMRHANHYVRGDQGTESEVDRRFSQFSADISKNNPVTVRIVINTDFTKYSIIPSAKGIASTITDNEVVFNLTEAGQYVFRVNDNNITNLAIFADALEEDVPSKTAKNVVVFNDQNPAPNAIGSNGKTYSSDTIFYIEDWQEVEFFELQSGQQLYIAPGAVLNARVQIMDGQSGISISGRGMLRDFNDTRAYDAAGELKTERFYNYLLTVGSSWNHGDALVTNVNIKDIILFDAKGFNLVFQGTQSCGADGIKIVSNEISTDGVSVWASNYTSVKNSFLYVNDNVFVIDQATGLKLDNLLIGTTIATFFPQNPIEGAHEYKNINIFRSSTIFEPAAGYGSKIYGGAAAGTVLIENLSAIDCVAASGGTGSKMGKLFSTFSSASGSADVKKVTFRNVTLPVTNNSYAVEVGVNNAKAGNYNITLENVYVGTTALTNDNVNFTDATTSGKASTLTVTNDGSYTPVTKNETTATATVYETYVRDASTGAKYFALTQPYKKNSVIYISAKATAEALGFATSYDSTSKTLTIYDGRVTLELTVGSNIATYRNSKIALSGAVEFDEEVMVPMDFFQKTIAPKTKISGQDIVIGSYNRGSDVNLIENGDFEDKDALESWTTINFARLTRSTVAASGSYALRFADSSLFKSEKISNSQGAYQNVLDIVRANGTGVYRITFKAKSNTTSVDLTDTSNYYIFANVYGNEWMTTTVPSGVTKQALTTSWTEYTQDIVVTDSKISSGAAYAAIVIKGAIDVSVDDITFTKVSDISTNSGKPSLTVTSDVDSNTLSYGVTGKTVTTTGTDTAIQTATFEAANDYIKVGTTSHTGSYTATATVEVLYPSKVERVARVNLKTAGGTVVGEIEFVIPASDEEPEGSDEPEIPDGPTVIYEEKKVDLTADNLSFEKFYSATSYRGSASSEMKNTANLLDGDSTTYSFYNNYKGSITQLDHYLEVIIDLGEEKDLSKISIAARSKDWSYPSPVNPEILVAGEDGEYKTVYTYVCQELETKRIDSVELDHTTTGADVRYIKYRYDSIVRNSTIAEIEVYEMVAIAGDEPTEPDTPVDPDPDEPTEPDTPTVTYEEKEVELTVDNLSFEKFYPDTSYRGSATSETKNPANMLDGDKATYSYYTQYKDSISKLGHYYELIIDLGEEKDITKINVHAGSTAWTYVSPVTPEILVAGEDGEYTSVYSYVCSALETARTDSVELDYASTGKNIRYIKYRYDSIVRSAAIAEIEVYEMIVTGEVEPEEPDTPDEPELPNEANLVTLGASIRFADEKLSPGIRFGAAISKNDLYDTYYPTTDENKTYNYSDDNNYQFGAIMIPKALIPEGETVVSMYESKNTNVLDIVGKKVYDEDEETITFTGVLVGIPETVDGYTTTIQTVFYVRYRESAEDEWTYIFSTILEDSYYSVAVKAAESKYNSTNIPTPTDEEKAIMETLNNIIAFVEKEEQ